MAAGGFRSTLALMISILALILAIAAYERTGGEDDVSDLRTKIEEVRQETSKRFEDIRKETGEALEKIGKAVQRD
jgi:hypothetical protein